MVDAYADDDRDRDANTDCVDDNEADDSSSDSGSEDSDTEFDKKPRQVPRKPVDQLLKAVLRKLKDRKPFDEIDLTDLDGDTPIPAQPTALHILVNTEKDDLPREKELKPLVEHLVKSPRGLLKVQEDNGGLTPLHQAIKVRNRNMVKWMCLAYIDAEHDINEVLAIKSLRNENCMHLAIQKSARMANFLVDLASAETLSLKDGGGNTPLHLAVEHARCNEKQLDLIKAIVDKCDHRMKDIKDGDFNKASRSPYRHHLFTCEVAEKKRRTEEQARKEKLSKIENSKDKSAGKCGRILSAAGQDARLNPAPAPAAFKTPIEPPSRTIEESLFVPSRPLRSNTYNAAHPGGFATPPSGEPEQHGKWSAPSKHNPIPQLPSSRNEQHSHRPGFDIPAPNRNEERGPRLKKDKAAREPAIASTKDPKPGRDRDTSTQNAAALEKIRKFLKVHYLRARSHSEALEILYGREATRDNPYKEIYLDLRGFPSISKRDIRKMISNLQFDDVLQSVDIARISRETVSPAAANSKKVRRRPNKPDGEGRDDMIEVLEWLRGVTTILKLSVDDLEHPAHSDVAIEMALRGKAVEIWDWRKVDICSEVIRKAAPDVREVHLHWSGQNAVLRAWSEDEGLPLLKCLKKIVLHIKQGIEPHARLEQNVAEFTRRMTRHFIRHRASEMAKEWVEELAREVSRVVGKTSKDRARNAAREISDLMTQDLAGETARVKHIQTTTKDSAPEEGQRELTRDAARELMKERAKELAKAMSSGDESQVNDNAEIATKKLVRDMAKEIARQCPNLEIDQRYPQQPQGIVNSDDLSTQRIDDPTDKPPKHQWIESMREFKHFLFNAEANLDKDDCLAAREPIVVALIDDGVDFRELELTNCGKVDGLSFFPRPEDPNRPIPFYESTSGHGTVMATQIRRICPRADLYVLKLQDYTDVETNKRRITLRSAAQVSQSVIPFR